MDLLSDYQFQVDSFHESKRDSGYLIIEQSADGKIKINKGREREKVLKIY